MTTPGRRVVQDADGSFPALQPGDYLRDKATGQVLYWPPGAAVGPWAAHKDKQITEHEDGTLTVAPSILCTYSKLQPGMAGAWHGHLERGVWKQA